MITIEMVARLVGAVMRVVTIVTVARTATSLVISTQTAMVMLVLATATAIRATELNNRQA
jgi:hypothetical protein